MIKSLFWRQSLLLFGSQTLGNKIFGFLANFESCLGRELEISSKFGNQILLKDSGLGIIIGKWPFPIKHFVENNPCRPNIYLWGYLDLIAVQECLWGQIPICACPLRC